MRNVKILTIVTGVFVCAACIAALPNYSDDVHYNRYSCLSWLPGQGYVDVCKPATFKDRWGVPMPSPQPAAQVMLAKGPVKCWGGRVLKAKLHQKSKSLFERT
jgi:hypothetical protein